MLEPKDIRPDNASYRSMVSRAFNQYNQEKDKKDARSFLKSYVGRDKSRLIDNVPDSHIIMTFGWMARMYQNGCQFKTEDQVKLDTYVKSLLTFKAVEAPVIEEKVKPERLGVRDYLEDKVKEYIGELEGTLDSIIYEQKDFDFYKDLQARTVPAQYCSYLNEWLKRKAGEYIAVYESKDPEIKAAYNHIGKRGLTSLIKTLSQWLEELERYSQFKKANRKPRVKKLKPAGVQVSKLKYKKEDEQLKIKSVSPTEMVGASQVWIYNTRYKKLSVYRTESRDGIQVKGTSLQNYDPSMCEQKTLRKPLEILKKVIDGGKIQLRRLLTELSSKETAVTGRINEDCIIVRAIR